MKRAIIFINIFALIFAVYTVYKISISDYEEGTLSAEKAIHYKEKIAGHQNIEKLRELSTHAVNYQESLSTTLNQGMWLFEKTVLVFLGLALLNIVVAILPEKKPNQTLKRTG